MGTSFSSKTDFKKMEKNSNCVTLVHIPLNTGDTIVVSQQTLGVLEMIFNVIFFLEWITTDVTCVDAYKVSVFVGAQKLMTTAKMAFRSSICIPKYENRFCLDEDKSFNWIDYQPCNLVKNSTLIDCPQYRGFTSFNDFSSWTSRTTTVKIRGYDHTNGTSTPVAVETKSVVVTPLFRCPDIDLIGPGNSMFTNSGQTPA